MQTMGSVYKTFQERDFGSIEAGKLAGLVACNKDFLTIPPDGIKDVKAEATIPDGKAVYRNPQSSLPL